MKALLAIGADIYRGNYQGETPLVRSVLSTHNYDLQTFPALLEILHPSIRTIDTAKRTVLHHAVLTAGVKGRAPFARYYLEGVLSWIAQHENADFKSIIDLQDEHGDTALNIAARVGNKGLVRTLLDVGANRLLPNKLGLRPGDFGVEPEVRTSCLHPRCYTHSNTSFHPVQRQKIWFPPSEQVHQHLSRRVKTLLQVNKYTYLVFLWQLTHISH